jgi:hypothetical protein
MARYLVHVSTGLALAAGFAQGCAQPCIDDGLGQMNCPEGADAEADGTGSSSEADATADEETGEGEGMTCDLFSLDLTPQTPTIVLLVDQSESMTAAFDTTDRWTAIRDTLLDPMNGVVTTLQDEVRFGLSLYSSNDGHMGGTCPILTETPPALDNLPAIQMVFDDSGGPLGDTPTGESLALVAAALAMDQAPGDKYVVLATDGEPDTCAMPDPQMGQPESVMAAQEAFAQGIETFVISVGEEISEMHLQDLANAGAGVQAGDPDAPFYMALDQQALLDAFTEIVQGVRDCQIDLVDPIFPDKANLCTVLVNMEEVPFDDPNGWQVNAEDEIELVGTACTSIQEGEVTIEMECDCSAIQ